MRGLLPVRIQREMRWKLCSRVPHVDSHGVGRNKLRHEEIREDSKNVFGEERRGEERKKISNRVVELTDRRVKVWMGRFQK